MYGYSRDDEKMGSEVQIPECFRMKMGIKKKERERESLNWVIPRWLWKKFRARVGVSVRLRRDTPPANASQFPGTVLEAVESPTSLHLTLL